MLRYLVKYGEHLEHYKSFAKESEAKEFAIQYEVYIGLDLLSSCQDGSLSRQILFSKFRT